MSHLRYLLEIQESEVSLSSLEFNGERNLEVVDIGMKLIPRGKLPQVDSGP